MLMTVLKGDLAVTQSKMLIRTFKEMKHFIQNNSHIFAELDNIKNHLLESDLHHKETQGVSFRGRFLIIDNSTIYHIGASLKDLGKKCFCFDVLDSGYIPMILKNI